MRGENNKQLNNKSIELLAIDGTMLVTESTHLLRCADVSSAAEEGCLAAEHLTHMARAQGKGWRAGYLSEQRQRQKVAVRTW